MVEILDEKQYPKNTQSGSRLRHIFCANTFNQNSLLGQMTAQHRGYNWLMVYQWEHKPQLNISNFSLSFTTVMEQQYDMLHAHSNGYL